MSTRPLRATGKYRSLAEHRFIMEQKLGRRLTAHELVHHINGDRADNRIENLEVVTKRGHGKIHAPLNHVRPRGRRMMFRITEDMSKEIRRRALINHRPFMHEIIWLLKQGLDVDPEKNNV